MFVAVVTFILVVIVMYISQRIEIMKVRMPERETKNTFELPTSELKSNTAMAKSRLNVTPQRETRNEFVLPTSKVKTNRTKTRLNVILLTHFSSGSTVVGNMFNLHPDVFYLYEPLHGLRREINTSEWRALQKSTNDAFRNDLSTLLRDVFTCGFQEKRTIDLVFPEWAKPFTAWYSPSKPCAKNHSHQDHANATWNS